ncbi:MAG TPA: ATP-binding protein [Paludibacter sp.]|nr:ATP-binding protein [Paludibacter sp.]
MIKVAILGPESTGKSSLAKSLAEYFITDWVPEYAREYIENLTDTYTYKDVCNIAKKQIEQEKEYTTKSSEKEGYIFFDTELIITKVWFEYKFGLVPDFLSEQLATGFFDYYLLCAPDLPWIPDPVREHGNDREFFLNWYKREIEQLNKPYSIITGIGNQRIKNALEALRLLKS